MQSINLQIAPGSVNPVINVSQNDVGRQFQLKLYDGAAAYTLPTGTTASIEGIKPDGHAFSYSDAVSVSGSILTVTTKLQMTVVAGRVICEIRLRKSGLDLGSLNFVMLVEESPINENVDPSDTEIPAIIELAEGQVEDAEAWAKGTKNGEPVPDTAPQYHNNAQWYAEHVAASLDALSNVNISSPANEDVLEYNSTTQKWKNSGAVRQLKQALSDEVATRATLGTSNLDVPINEESYNVTYSRSNNGYQVISTASSTWTNVCFYYKLPKNKDIKILTNVSHSAGNPRIAVYGNSIPTESGRTNITTKVINADGAVEVSFNTGNYEYIAVALFASINTAAQGDVTYANFIIKLPNDPNTSYTEPAMTNQQLTTDKAEKSDLASINITGTTNNTGATIPKGRYFYLNGILVKAKAAISNAAALTLNTNYEVVTIGSEIETINAATINGFRTVGTVSANGTKKYSEGLVELYALHNTVPSVLKPRLAIYTGDGYLYRYCSFDNARYDLHVSLAGYEVFNSLLLSAGKFYSLLFTVANNTWARTDDSETVMNYDLSLILL